MCDSAVPAPLTTQTREVQGTSGLPWEQVSGRSRLLRRHPANILTSTGQVLSQRQYFLVSKEIHFPWQNTPRATLTQTPHPTFPEPRRQAARGLLTAAVYWSQEKVTAGQRSGRDEQRLKACVQCVETGRPSVSALEKRGLSLDGSAVSSSGKIERLSGFTC